MRIEERSPDDFKQLHRLIRQEPLTKQRDRYRAVALALAGHSAPQIAHKLDRSRRFVQHWCYAYRDGGIQAITPRRQTGRPTHLPCEQNHSFKQRLLDGPQPHDAVCSLRGQDARIILEKEFGVRYSLSAVYALMHRLGLSCLKPRPQHRKNDAETMKQWLDEAPFLFSASVTNSPIESSRSGSRTKPVSANKEP